MTNTKYHGMTHRQITHLIRSAIHLAHAHIGASAGSDSETVSWLPASEGKGYLCLVILDRHLENRREYGIVGRCEQSVILRLPRKDAVMACKALRQLGNEIDLACGIDARQFETYQFGELCSYHATVRVDSGAVSIKILSSSHH